MDISKKTFLKLSFFKIDENLPINHFSIQGSFPDIKILDFKNGIISFIEIANHFQKTNFIVYSLDYNDEINHNSIYLGQHKNKCYFLEKRVDIPD